MQGFEYVHDPGEALALHVAAFFEGHEITTRRWELGPIERRIPGFFAYEIAPGPRFPGWTYVSSGAWKASAVKGHGLEFVLSSKTQNVSNVELLHMLAYYHSGPDHQRLDIGHTVDIGESWLGGDGLDSLLVSLPYAYGPDLEILEWGSGVSHARLLTALPISKAERAYARAHGVEALEQLFDKAQIDILDPDRPHVIDRH